MWLRIHVIKLLFVHFGWYLLIGTMDFQKKLRARKPFPCILFFDNTVEILTSSSEKFTLKGKPIKWHFSRNNMSTYYVVDFFFLKFYGAILEIPGITCRHVSPNYPHSGNNMFMCYEYHIRPEFTGYYVEMIFGENRTFFLEIAKFYIYRNIVRHHLNFFGGRDHTWCCLAPIEEDTRK